MILTNVIWKCFSDKESDLLQFTLRSDVIVMSANPLKPIESSVNDIEIDIPSLHPMHHIIGLDKTNFYRTEDFYRKFNICLKTQNSLLHTVDYSKFL